MQAQSHILVVDDDREIRTLLGRYLDGQGFRVSVAADRRECEQKLGSGQFDLIVLDVMLPDGSGLDICRSLRDRKPHIPVILLTALKEDVDRIIGLELGADDYLGKPFNPRELAARIRAGENVSVPRSELAKDPPDTTVNCVMDEEGNAVTITHTLGQPSGAITNGLGFMYNGTMSGFDPRPGRAASIAPGKARGSAMAPTIVFENDKPVIAIGAPGGTFIVPALAQALSNVIDFGMSMADAVAAPRLVCLSDTIDVSNRIERRVTAQLEAMGYPVARSYQSFAFGAPHGVKVDGAGWSGGSDPQRDGMAIAV